MTLYCLNVRLSAMWSAMATKRPKSEAQIVPHWGQTGPAGVAWESATLGSILICFDQLIDLSIDWLIDWLCMYLFCWFWCSYLQCVLYNSMQRWSAAYRSPELTFILYTNNGTRNMAEDFRHEFMSNYTEVSLSELLSGIIRHQLPALLGTYVTAHTIISPGLNYMSPGLL